LAVEVIAGSALTLSEHQLMFTITITAFTHSEHCLQASTGHNNIYVHSHV